MTTVNVTATDLDATVTLPSVPANVTMTDMGAVITLPTVPLNTTSIFLRVVHLITLPGVPPGMQTMPFFR